PSRPTGPSASPTRPRWPACTPTPGRPASTTAPTRSTGWWSAVGCWPPSSRARSGTSPREGHASVIWYERPPTRMLVAIGPGPARAQEGGVRMPPEHDDYRENQLAALRRYVSDLDVRRQQQPGQAQPGERRRTIWPWLLGTLLLMAVSLAGGIALGGGGQRRASGFAS